MANKIPLELRALGIAILLGVLLSTLVSILIYYTGAAETIIGLAAKFILVISVFTGGCVVSKGRGNRGLVRGISMGIMFFILMLIATLVAAPGHIYFQGFLYTLLACIISGGLGGILGIGLSEG